MSYTKDTYYKENHNRMIDMTHHLYKVITDKEPTDDKIELLNNILREDLETYHEHIKEDYERYT